MKKKRLDAFNALMEMISNAFFAIIARTLVITQKTTNANAIHATIKLIVTDILFLRIIFAR